MTDAETSTWIMHSLGAPHTRVELDDAHIKECIQNGKEHVTGGISRELNEREAFLARRYALAFAKRTLGYVRSKYDSLASPNGDVRLNGKQLLEDARTEELALERERLNPPRDA
jgi:hypothetical protein